MSQIARVYGIKRLQEEWGYSVHEAQRRMGTFNPELEVPNTPIIDAIDRWVHGQGETGIDRHFREVEGK